MRRKIWKDLPAFAPQAASTDRMAIASVTGWRLWEPDSGRRYTVLRLETRGGLVGYGEGGPAVSAAILEARAAATGRRPNETEFIRHRLDLCRWRSIAQVSQRSATGMSEPTETKWRIAGEEVASCNCEAAAGTSRMG